MIVFELNDEDAKLLILFRQHQDKFRQMINGHVFDLDTSTAVINFNKKDQEISSIKTERYFYPKDWHSFTYCYN